MCGVFQTKGKKLGGSLIINDVIKTSLVLLKIINVFVNFLILSDTLLFKYSSLLGENLMEFRFCQ